MADRVLNVNVISPEKILYSGVATYIKIPGSDGSFGVMYNHASLVSEIDLGILEVQNGSVKTKIFVDGGFAQIQKNVVNILAKSGEISDQINKADIQTRLNEISSKKDSASLKEIKVLKSKLSI
jgi:F-type H+-transporting ATPase subunit epsilon